MKIEIETDRTVTIEIMKDGPLIVSGLKNWQNSKGEALETKERITLCRCGASSNKPYCDGSHVVTGFSGKRETDKSLYKEKSYAGEKVTVHDNRMICCHAAECVENLSSVFSLEQRPWINADGAEIEKIIEVIGKCPSGALSYTIDDVRKVGKEEEPSIRISNDGPYNVSGGITLNVEDELQPPSKEKYSLCRCGASKNKPYCDGAHHDINFVDEKN